MQATRRGGVSSRLVERIEQGIRTHEFAPGSRLPSEAQLVREYEISRVSVRRALGDLEKRQLIVKQPGKGTFVSHPRDGGQKTAVLPIGISSPWARRNDVTDALYLLPIHEAVTGACTELGYRLEWVDFRTVMQGKASGLTGVVCISYSYESIRELPSASDASAPVVLVNRIAKEKGFHSVTIDHYKAARSAVEYLVALGHRRIALATTDFHADHLQPRYHAYRDVLTENGIHPDPGWVIEGLSWDSAQRAAQMESLLSRHAPTAIFIPAGRPEGGVLMALHQLGVKIPDDISVVSFDDVPNPMYPLVPSITTVRLPLADLGHAAVRLLDRVRKGTVTSPVAQMFETELVVRESCKRLA